MSEQITSSCLLTTTLRAAWQPTPQMPPNAKLDPDEESRPKEYCVHRSNIYVELVRGPIIIRRCVHETRNSRFMRSFSDRPTGPVA